MTTREHLQQTKNKFPDAAHEKEPLVVTTIRVPKNAKGDFGFTKYKGKDIFIHISTIRGSSVGGFSAGAIPEGLRVIILSTKQTSKGLAVESAVTEEAYLKNPESYVRYPAGQLCFKNDPGFLIGGEIPQSGVLPDYTKGMHSVDLASADFLYDHKIAYGEDLLRKAFEEEMASKKKHFLDVERVRTHPDLDPAEWARAHPPRIEVDEKGNGTITFPLQGDAPENVVLAIESNKIPLGNLQTHTFTDERRSGVDDTWMTIDFDSIGGRPVQDLDALSKRNSLFDNFRACFKDEDFYYRTAAEILTEARQRDESQAAKRKIHDKVSDIPLLYLHHAYAFNPDAKGFLQGIREQIISGLEKNKVEWTSTPMYADHQKIYEEWKNLFASKPDVWKEISEKMKKEQEEASKACYVCARLDGVDATFRLLTDAAQVHDNKQARRLVLFGPVSLGDGMLDRNGMQNKNHEPPEITFIAEHVKGYDQYSAQFPKWQSIVHPLRREIAKQFGFDYLYSEVDNAV